MAASLSTAASAYHRLRNIEKIYLGLSAIGVHCTQNPKLALVRRWIQDPRSYSYLATVNEHDIVEAAVSISTDFAPISLGDWQSRNRA